MSAGKLNLVVEKGARFQRTWVWKDSAGVAKNLTGYTAEIQFTDSTGVKYDSDTGSDITITPLTGTIALDIPTATTTAFTFDRAKWALELTVGGETVRLLEGWVDLSVGAIA
jgi:hypothetical protein